MRGNNSCGGACIETVYQLKFLAEHLTLKLDVAGGKPELQFDIFGAHV